MSSQVFFRPPDAWVGDVIPFRHDGAFWLFYLLEERRPGGGTPWNLVRTTDFVTFDDAGTALPNGDASSDDLNAYTGSVVVDQGVHHAFYTGHNPAIVDEATGEPLQVVMHAVSHDAMASWTKLPRDTFAAPDTGYERGDWRDPFVFRPEEDGPWRMLLAARRDSGPARRRGLIAQCVSEDLSRWRVVEPFWDPHLYVTHECPDVFRIGPWWYLVYSEFSERFTTRYRVSRSPHGPWRVPRHDSLDGRGFYAAKTVSDGDRRFAVGWVPTKEGDRDDGAWQWAGDMAIHEIVQRQDGSLDVLLPREIADSFTRTVPCEVTPVLGEWRTDGALSAAAPDSFATAVGSELPDRFLATVTIELTEDTVGAGLAIRTSADGDEGYQFRLEPRAGRLVFDRWPRTGTGHMQWQVSGDVPHVVELERPARLGPGAHRLTLLVDGTVCLAYLDDQVAMSTRIYDRRTGGIGVFVTEGHATFTGLEVRTRP